MEKQFKELDENFEAAKEIEINTMAVFMEDDWKNFKRGT
jgi:hypothetical protein